MLEGLKSGNVAESCRKYEIAPTLYYRWKDEVEEGARAALDHPSRASSSNSIAPTGLCEGEAKPSVAAPCPVSRPLPGVSLS